MSRNKQRSYAVNRQSQVATEQPAEIEELESEAVEVITEPSVAEETTPMEVGVRYEVVQEEEAPVVETEEPIQPDVVLPEASETIFNDEPSVDLAQEAQDRRSTINAELLTEDEVMSKVNLTARMSLLSILDYASTMEKLSGHALVLMNDHNFVVNDGPRQNVILYQNIMDIITKTDDVSFRYAMDFLLQLFVTKGKEGQPFSYLSLARFQENLKMNTVDLYCYPNLIRMLTLLADPVTRAKEMRGFDFERALQYGFSEEAKTRLVSYFKN